ncbi:MAG TPA: S-layer homology domain-containing protein [Acetivibrio clariflavus]|nr:S-layer homology domain-containing protein [Acetivibrio clariflavus]
MGYEDGSFRPYNKITRAELITAVSKAYKIEPVGSTTNDFADFEVIPQWALGYINAAVEKGIIKGYPDLTFRPQSNIKRSEVFAVIYNCISWYDKQSKN